jgi:CRP/FNR family transcriptional regulator
MAGVAQLLRVRPRASDCAHPHCMGCEARRIGICAAVGPGFLPRLSALASEQQLATGATLFEEGDAAESVYVVTHGMLKLYKGMVDGRRQVIGFMVVGDFLGLAFGRLHLCTAEAVTPASVCRFRRQRFLELLDECPSLEREILHRTSTELAVAQEQMLLLGRKTASERLASFVLCLSRRLRLPDDQPFELPMSRGDIADYLGLTVETVSRTLSGFRRSALIDLDKHRVAVRRPRELQRVAGLTECGSPCLAAG